MKWIRFTWDAIWQWVDWQGRLTTVVLLIVSLGGAALVGRAASIWANVTGLYVYVVMALTFAIFLGTIVLIGRKLETQPRSILRNEETPKAAIEGHPNITWNRAFMQKVVFEEAGYFRLMVPYETNFMFALMIEIGNRAEKGKNVVSAGEIKAQLNFKLKQGHYEASPGAWLEHPFNSVRLGVGDTRRLILALSQDCFVGWRMISNRRNNSEAPICLDYTSDIPLLAEGEIQIDFLGAESGSILRTLEAGMSWRYQSWPVLTGMKES